MFSNITIMIPTLGRLDKQITLDYLSRSHPLLDRITLVTTHSEHRAHWNKYAEQCVVIGAPDNIKGIAATRQWCVENCPTDYLFILDDDMVFFKRDDLDIRLSKSTPNDLEEMFQELISWLEFEDFLLVGLSARQGNNNVYEDYVDVTRQMNFHGINIKMFKDYGFRFDGLKVMEDFNLLLNMFTRAIPNRVSYRYCWNQSGSGAKGGCSTYRTGELQKQCALELKERFPDFVAVVEKKSKSGWDGLETRTDVRIQWKKAFKYGSEQNEL